ncbi:type IV / VI secretion system protein, DotU family [Desulfocurvibacter africanus PCS]|uniref:Type IV / VI secretion system protein, DotU family n=1 Tax=Desulfocurvibacter africanus PCS TaxID=1262666 RepID=M5Q3D8_DESAF|nr:DotU family type IV/VI secretion system protein [Desulfocurvibacter africanus]EMG38273.1 type IV / VI secretion system protein, DotU family [Desulfocurvibacter africanus PCS]
MRLVDCFIETFTFTRQMLESVEGLKPTIAQVREDVDKLLARSEQRRNEGKFPAEDFDNARFAVCAWIDETILCSSWESRAGWLREHLQRRYYNTTNAGVEFFERLGKLPDDKSQVREVYLYCLAFGYRGRFYSEEQKTLLDEIKRVNTRLLLGEDRPGGCPSGDLFPGAYAQDPGPGQRKSLVRLDPWLAVFFLAPLGVLTGLYMVYHTYLDRAMRAFLGGS